MILNLMRQLMRIDKWIWATEKCKRKLRINERFKLKCNLSSRIVWWSKMKLQWSSMVALSKNQISSTMVNSTEPLLLTSQNLSQAFNLHYTLRLLIKDKKISSRQQCHPLSQKKRKKQYTDRHLTNSSKNFSIKWFLQMTKKQLRTFILQWICSIDIKKTSNTLKRMLRISNIRGL